MTGLFGYAEERAERERDLVDRLRSELVQRSEAPVPSGLELIREVAEATATDLSTVQEEYWTLLNSGKLKLGEGTAVKST